MFFWIDGPTSDLIFFEFSWHFLKHVFAIMSSPGQHHWCILRPLPFSNLLQQPGHLTTVIDVDLDAKILYVEVWVNTLIMWFAWTESTPLSHDYANHCLGILTSWKCSAMLSMAGTLTNFVEFIFRIHYLNSLIFVSLFLYLCQSFLPPPNAKWKWKFLHFCPCNLQVG